MSLIYPAANHSTSSSIHTPVPDAPASPPWLHRPYTLPSSSLCVSRSDWPSYDVSYFHNASSHLPHAYPLHGSEENDAPGYISYTTHPALKKASGPLSSHAYANHSRIQTSPSRYSDPSSRSPP